MHILYHLTVLPPKMPECDAVVQEVEALQHHFGGEICYLNPNQRLPLHLPRVFFGIHKLEQMRCQETSLQLHHVFNPDPFPFPILRALRRPIVYSLTGGVDKRKMNVPFFASLAAVTVADERSLKYLGSLGLDNVILVHPGINTNRFTCSHLSLGSEIRLMVGSAPGSQAQFRTKGVDALLSAAQRFHRLRLVFLWRGVLADEMERRVSRMNLDDQVKILNRKVDVNKVLTGVHASVALATNSAIIRPYPHSLIESLAAGKPVIVSRCIPMADYVERTGCGKIVENIDPTSILAAVESLVDEYDSLQKAARGVGQKEFAQQKMIASYQRVYKRVLEQATGGIEGKMFNNLINWQDFCFLANSLRTGSIRRVLKRLIQRKESAVKSSWKRVELPPPYLWSIPSVQRRVNRLITGDSDNDYITYVSQTYLSPLQPLHGISLGCGTGHKELSWVNHCRYARLDAYDVSAPRIEYAHAQARTAGHEEIHYHVGDVYQIDWPKSHYDVVFGDQSLHHFTPLETLLLQARRALKPTGYLVVSEFIGPTRFQWTDRQLEVINGVLTILPHRYRQSWKDGRIKSQVYRPSRLRMMLNDPSEAVESARIVPLIERHFEIVERRDYGCTILHMLFDEIAGNFLDDEGQEKDGEARRLLNLCFQIEDTLLELGDIQSDFALLICKPLTL